jgi:hypothetical protein
VGEKDTASNHPIPYIVFEGELARQERTIKRLWILVIILVLLLVGSNGAWLYYESQFNTIEAIKVMQDVDTDSGNAIVNGTGEVTVNGKD